MKLEELIQECCKQKIAAQAKVYQIFSDKLFAVCLKYSHNKEDAEDNLQDSFITIFEKIEQYKNKGSFEGWLKRITINTALQKYREKAPLQIVEEVSNKVEVEELELKNTVFNVDVLLGFIQQLPDRYRLIFNLYVLDNYSHKEIAEMLAISVGTSKSNLSRARKILKEKLEGHQKKNENSI
ncbi:RNA polymerase sigma factor [Polaribacter sp. SA4-12]|uniref:RNA polymerase sigma factor n=1 Tax=Polaribacter sp. SA4-12 TaxID=1312072 RepID=UPI000B3C7E1C|nr:RNA polymerase sigma factor [Polaribacter sp. SA4-12]ARV15885.1 RNA polymerase subunit sigma-70 [Polaribacter sp. SA4-12]